MPIDVTRIMTGLRADLEASLEPQLRAALESVLSDGETLDEDVLAATVASGVDASIAQYEMVLNRLIEEINANDDRDVEVTVPTNTFGDMEPATDTTLSGKIKTS